MHDRTIRSRRRGLNPTKIVFVYCLAMMLVCVHQAGRVADWFEDLGLSREGLVSEVSFKAAAVFRHRIDPWGPSQLNRAENWVLALFKPGSVADRVEGPPDVPSEPGVILPGWMAKADSGSPSPPVVEDPPPPERPGAGGGATDPPIPWALDARPVLPSPPSDQEVLASLRPTTPRPADAARVFNPARVLLLGDSMMLEGLGPPLQRELKKNEGLTVYRDGRYGTGLVRLDNFDWLAYFDQMLEKYQPDLIILTLGANDTQDMVEEGRRLTVGGQEWTERYAQRVADLLSRAEARGVRVFWVGLPIMGREPYGSRANHINQVVDAVCQVAANCRYWDSWLAVADAKGQFATFLPDDQGKSVRVRSKDSIHLTEIGGRIMAEKFLSETAAWADYKQAVQAGPGDAQSRRNGALPQTPPGGISPWTPDRKLCDKQRFRSIDLKDAETASKQAVSEGFKMEDAPGAGLGPAPHFYVEERGLAPSAGDGDDDDYDEPEPLGRLTLHRFFSELRGREVPYLVAAPEAAAGVRRPLVLLLHGAWDGYGVWAERLGDETLARLAAERCLILVMPDGEPFGWYLDGRETAIESYLMTELLPRVLAEQPEADPGRLGVVGLSMGGHGALTLALKHPEIFKAVGSMSGVTDLAAHAGRQHKVDPELKIDRVLGPPGPGGQNWRPHSALGLTEKTPDRLAGRPLMLSVGTGDRLTLAENRAYHELLTRLKIDHVYLEGPGGHGWDYWAAQLPVHLDFMADKLKAGGDR